MFYCELELGIIRAGKGSSLIPCNSQFLFWISKESLPTWLLTPFLVSESASNFFTHGFQFVFGLALLRWSNPHPRLIRISPRWLLASYVNGDSTQSGTGNNYLCRWIVILSSFLGTLRREKWARRKYVWIRHIWCQICLEDPPTNPSSKNGFGLTKNLSYFLWRKIVVDRG